MRALIITGLANRGGAQEIQLDLQERGYEVDTIKWYEKPPRDDYVYVFAHSMGSIEGTRYARNHPESEVFVMGAIVNEDIPNITSVGEYTDPVAVIGLIASGQKGFDVHTSEIEGLNPHSKNQYYDAIKSRVVNVSGSWDTSRRGQVFGE